MDKGASLGVGNILHSRWFGLSWMMGPGLGLIWQRDDSDDILLDSSSAVWSPSVPVAYC